MSLFGAQPQQQQSGGLFGNTANKTPSLFGNTQQQPATGGSLFGNAQNKPATGTGLFGSTTTTTQQPASGGGLFGASTNQAQPQQQTSSLFGASQTQNKPAGGLFGGQQNTQAQTQPSGIFGSTTTTQQKPAGSLFGSTTQQTQQSGTGLFGATNNAQQQQSLFGGGSLFGNQQQQQQPQQQQQQQTPQLGQTLNQSQLGSSLWSPGRAITGVHRTVPAQMEILKDKWDPTNLTSPFRGYTYNHPGEDHAPFFQPTAEDDPTKWEEALKSRPGPGYVPLLLKGFMELGQRAVRQKDFLSALQTRLHQINNILTDLLSRHDLKISVRIADCRRKHLVLSQRCLSLAAKTQILRNRGYAMDDAEEELKKKLIQLERAIFDPSITGRAEEIWARMLAVREHSKRLAAEIEKTGSAGSNNEGEAALDENAMKTAKKILEDYASQIQHLQKELTAIGKELDEAQKLAGTNSP
ncbi:nucleoporin, putative [Talaromyces stipitatus ATCC 10500]|uniref:Nucleoporin, putative n=1 Tax=Talaromyces stipitatus (strain ATCC 10500 / CBS 375.48 / QM 6759 / NRRL 1006) TaxID=441959 RepID=B8MK09_TALSN|nr:nucleoporin, putative [Talaromyces stipitatus ATCC 10500]EED14826.1 nucleoporin, putative [Talaromyces stipitatus ATCC 10500]